MTPEEEVQQLKALLHQQARRLDYAVMQLEREAKFMPKWKPENRRFYRAYDTVTEVRDTLEGAAR